MPREPGGAENRPESFRGEWRHSPRFFCRSGIPRYTELRVRAISVIAVLASATAAHGQLVTKLAPETLRAFEQYIANVEPKLISAAREPIPLPWLPDQIPKVKAGELAIRALTPKNGQEIPNGLVHDWVGAIFIAGAGLDKTVSALQDFDAHKRWYPEIIDSKLISRQGPEARGRWTMLKKKVITVVLRAELDSRYVEVNPTHGFLKSVTTQITEVQDHNTPNAHEYPPGEGHGFLWRFHGYWTVHQSDGGVYAECRVISLSRDVPSGLGWIVNPFVRSQPRESLISTLQNTKKALVK